VIALTDRTQPSPTPNWPPKRPALCRIRSCFDPSNECSKCPWSHAYRKVCAHVVHTLRCHFITTTELSKNTRPTRFSNWRNTQSSNLSERCQQVKTPIFKTFFRAVFCRSISAFRCQHPNGLLKANPNYIGRNTLGNPHQHAVVFPSFMISRCNTNRHKRLRLFLPPREKFSPPQTLPAGEGRCSPRLLPRFAQAGIKARLT